jgi:hypothetical protein
MVNLLIRTNTEVKNPGIVEQNAICRGPVGDQYAARIVVQSSHNASTASPRLDIKMRGLAKKMLFSKEYRGQKTEVRKGDLH